MKIFFIVTIFLALGYQSYGNTPKVPKKYQSYVQRYSDTTSYLQYLDSLIQTKKFCFTTDTTDVFLSENTEVPAQYPDGSVGLKKFIILNERYPELGRELNIQGKVIIRILIDESGNICNPKIIQHLGYDIDEDAIRVLELMKKWKPAIKSGVPVKSYYILEMPYKLM